ncbi:MAG: ABC-ATPase domain-containing protein [Lachnospiraceae bacterium]
MKTAEQLRQLLQSIDRKSYPAYKSTQGAYRFHEYILCIDHVQGDPFAAPSKISIQVPHNGAGFPAEYFDQPYRKTALEDYLIRQFGKKINQYNFKAKGSGKSGLICVSHPEPEILSRTACDFGKDGITARFEVGFPANGRTINSGELIKIFFDFLPDCIRSVFFHRNLTAKSVLDVIHLADDRQFILNELSRLKLVAFVANGAILPRESGASSKPMKMEDTIPFRSPASLQIKMELPHFGMITGMAIPRGITLIVGGGYHGKSTLLKALEAGVYPHIGGDGREYVVTDPSACKLRAEEGRSIQNVDISLFINDLPNQKDTRSFSTEDASGSTSQAANTIESMESGSQVFLIDEDTSATNFMVRDDLMQKIIRRNQEPITPFIERVRDLYEKAGISTVLVAGSSGAYFYIADTILQMDHYQPCDITEHTKAFCSQYGMEAIQSAPDFHLPPVGRKINIPSRRPSDSSHADRQNGRDNRIKVKVFGKDTIQLDKSQIELRAIEQLVDSEQAAALAQMMRYCLEQQLIDRYPVTDLVRLLLNQKDKWYTSTMGLCMPREQEIYACLNRYRG